MEDIVINKDNNMSLKDRINVMQNKLDLSEEVGNDGGRGKGLEKEGEGGIGEGRKGMEEWELGGEEGGMS